MVSLKFGSIRSSFPIKAIGLKGKSGFKREFNHVNCSDEETVKYFRNGSAARDALLELDERSWEYQFEFAVEMVKRCKLVMGSDPGMREALDVYERWYFLSDPKNSILTYESF
jgi:hypothetical protein